MYVVLVGFYDSKDNMHLYNAGDTYPRKGAKLDKKRAEELASDKNAAGVPLIKEKAPAK